MTTPTGESPPGAADTSPAPHQDGPRSTWLRRGDRGPEVLTLRALLVRAGERLPPRRPGAEDPTEDSFDEATDRAVRGFQQRRGLIADGIVGEQTARALNAARWRLGDRILLSIPGHRMHGDDVASLQERLLVLGLLHAPVDGVFGPRTAQALRELQQGLGLRDDGMCGPVTLRAIRALARTNEGGDAWALRQRAEGADTVARGLVGRVVVLDPGHGGGDTGARGHGLVEAEVTHDLAERVAERLRRAGVRPVLSRDPFDNPSIARRAELCGAVEADIALSLHCDGHTTGTPNGIATFFWGGPFVGSRSPMGERLAHLVQQETVLRTGLLDCRTHACTQDLLRLAEVPSARVELGYLTNARDASRLAHPHVREAVADALTAAVTRLFLEDPGLRRGDPPTAGAAAPLAPESEPHELR